MTDAQKEAAARELCRLRGVDPESMVGHSAEPDSRGFVPDIYLMSPAWRIAIAEIAAREQLDAALLAGRSVV
ncbi:hypothetical protein KC887_08555 [Candidatus Kaiserbacteria bacterium]|nr:hypothetical protein [Candidatus Kaiserbacteria bacterium]